MNLNHAGAVTVQKISSSAPVSFARSIAQSFLHSTDGLADPQDEATKQHVPCGRPVERIMQCKPCGTGVLHFC